MAGSRSSFNVCIAPGCVTSFFALRDSFPLLSITLTEIFSAIADTTSFSIPSFNLLTILKFAFFPADHEGSMSVFLSDFAEPELIFSKCVINSDNASGLLLKIKFSTSFFSFSSISVYGVISFTLTIALSNPAFTA